MKKKIFTLCAMLLALCSLADAQWIIDGQQVQTLNLNVSDPQALYTDGSREMTAPLAFSSSLSPTSGLMRATIPWAGEHSFFIFDDGEEVLKLSDGDIGFQLGSLIMSQFGISQTSEGTAVDFGEHMLSGGWQIDQVLPYPEAIISRGYADARYLRKDIAATAPISFDPALTATSGLFRAYIPWSGLTADLLQMDGDDECLKLSSDPNVSFQVGGVTINQSGINGYGVSLGFEDNTLFGPWKLYEVTDNSKALLNRSYADARYVMNGQDSVELGLDTAATGDYSIAAGYKNLASGKYSVAFNGGVDPEEPTEGIYTNVASGIGSAVFGWGNVASGNGAVAFGWESVASGDWSFAAGSSDAIGEFSTALGEVCDASGSDSLAAGYNASATGDKSIAFGHSTTASAQGSFANGFLSTASGNYSTAWGSYCEASGPNSIAFGTRAKALHPGAVVFSDSQNADVTSVTNDTFTIRAKNGVYLQTDAIHSSGPLVFDSTLTTTNGALQIYATDNEDHLGYFKTLDFQDGLQFCTEGSSALFFGSGNDGLLVGPSYVIQLGYGKRLNFETGELTGTTGAKDWHVTTDPTDDTGIVSRGYADGRYLRSDTPLAAPIEFDPAYSGAAFKAYAVDDGITVGYFYPRTDENGLRLSGSTSSLLIGTPAEGLNLYTSSLYYSGTGARIGFEDRELDGGQWTVTSSPTAAGGIVSKGYADGRYLQRTEGITTNHVIQAGDTLVISNGLITAINP